MLNITEIAGALGTEIDRVDPSNALDTATVRGYSPSVG